MFVFFSMLIDKLQQITLNDNDDNNKVVQLNILTLKAVAKRENDKAKKETKLAKKNKSIQNTIKANQDQQDLVTREQKLKIGQTREF